MRRNCGALKAAGSDDGLAWWHAAAVGISVGKGYTRIMQSISRRTSFRAALAGAGLVALLAGCAQTQTGDPAQSYDSLMKVGDETAASGDLTSAAAFYRHAHEVQPNDPAALVKLGSVLNHLHAFTDAEGAFQAALKLKQGDAAALRGLGNTEVYLDRPAQAVQDFNGALKADPGSPDILNDLGVALDMQGRHQEAQASYRQGLKQRPGDLSLASNLGLSLAVTGNYQDALHYLGPLAADSRSSPETRGNLALVYGLNGDDQQAAKVASVDLDPKAVQANLAYYQSLRQWVETQRTGQAPQPAPTAPVTAAPM